MRGFKWVSMVFVLGVLLHGCASKDMMLSNKGFEEISKGRYAEAGTHLEEALRVNPDNPYALLNMGVVYHETGRLQKAREMYERVIALQPGEPASLSNMASFEGKRLVDLAKRNLELLKRQERASAVVSEKPLPSSSPSASTPQVTKPAEEEARDRLPATRGQEGEAAPPPESLVQPGEESRLSAESHYYQVRKGDTLRTIAGREDVYGDALKWPAIYRLNMDVLGGMAVSEGFLKEKLREGMHLKYLTAQGALHNLNALGDKLWVVDVASAQSLDGLVESAVLLMKNGSYVYFAERSLAAEEWIRLRIGFFEGLTEALAVSREVRSLLGVTKDPWVVKINKEELEAYGGY